MQLYKNIQGDSGVKGYKISARSIDIQFIDGTIYVYNYESTGKINVEKMKKLAKAGKGLSTFISTTVKDKFASKY